MYRSVPRPIAFAVCLSLLTILFGFALGGAFGAAEDAIKKRLADSGTAALETAYKGDAAAKDAVVKKCWEYLQRAHLHAGAIGTASLASISVLILLCPLGRTAQASALSFSVGGLLYSSFWLAAAFLAPGMGSTGAAKEALRVMAIPGAGLTILGAAGTVVCVARAAFCHRPRLAV